MSMRQRAVGKVRRPYPWTVRRVHAGLYVVNEAYVVVRRAGGTWRWEHEVDRANGGVWRATKREAMDDVRRRVEGFLRALKPECFTRWDAARQ